MDQRKILLLSDIKKHLLKRCILSVFVCIFIIIFIFFKIENDL